MIYILGANIMGKCENVILLMFVCCLHLGRFESINRIPPSTCYMVTLTATSIYHRTNNKPSETNIEKVIPILISPNLYHAGSSCNNSQMKLNNTNFTSFKNTSNFTLLYFIEPNDRTKKIEAYHCAENVNHRVGGNYGQLQELLKFTSEIKPILSVDPRSCCGEPDIFNPCCKMGFILDNDTCVKVFPTVLGSTVPGSKRLSLGLIIIVAASSLVFVLGVALVTIYTWRKKHPIEEHHDVIVEQGHDGEEAPIDTTTLTTQQESTTSIENTPITENTPVREDSRDSLSEVIAPYMRMTKTNSSSSASSSRPPSHPVMTFQFDKQIPLEDISFTGTLLGRGQFGQVELVKVIMNGATITCAAKMIRGRGTIEDERDLFEELQMLYRIPCHPNVVSLLGGSMEIDKPLYVLVEYCHNGNLLKYLQKHKHSQEYVNISMPKLDLRWKLNRAIEICTGMIFLAQKQIIHRDLAARNILLDKNEEAKICDFGMAKDVYLRGLYIKETPGFLPIRWMAIEAIESSIYTIKSDMWSFGILLWELYMDGLSPYPTIIDGGKLRSYLLNGYRMKQPEDCPEDFYKLMDRCWLQNPDDRPHFQQAKRELEFIRKAETRKESGASRETESSDDLPVFDEHEELEVIEDIANINLKNLPNENVIVNYGSSSDDISDESPVFDEQEELELEVIEDMARESLANVSKGNGVVNYGSDDIELKPLEKLSEIENNTRL